MRVPLGAEPRANRRRGVVERARDVVRRSAVPRDERHHAARPRARQWRYLDAQTTHHLDEVPNEAEDEGLGFDESGGETEETPRTETPRGETEEKHARSTTSAGSTTRIPARTGTRPSSRLARDGHGCRNLVSGAYEPSPSSACPSSSPSLTARPAPPRVPSRAAPTRPPPRRFPPTRLSPPTAPSAPSPRAPLSLPPRGPPLTVRWVTPHPAWRHRTPPPLTD